MTNTDLDFIKAHLSRTTLSWAQMVKRYGADYTKWPASAEWSIALDRIDSLYAAPTPIPLPLPTPTNPSGQAMPVGNIPGWHQIFTDDFVDNVPLGSFPGKPNVTPNGKWTAYPYGWLDTSKNGHYWPEKGLSVHDHCLDIYLHTENGVHISESPVPILPGIPNGQLYGRYAARWKFDSIPGYKTAWLLWPDSETWPRDGEIDFPEGNLDSTISAFMHRQNGTSGSDQDAYPTTVPEAGAWHTSVIEWLAGSCTFYLDDKVIGKSTSRIPSTPMHWVLQSETQLSGGPPADSAQGHLLVDWVAVYSAV